jgi:hypothetical protein
MNRVGSTELAQATSLQQGVDRLTFSQRLSALEALSCWSAGLKAQEDCVRRLTKGLVSDLWIYLERAGANSEAKLFGAIEGLDLSTRSDPFNIRQMREHLRRLIKLWSAAGVRRQSTNLWQIAVLSGSLLAVLSVLYVVLPGVLYPMSLTRMADFIQLRDALEMYRAEHGTYPVSRNAGGGNDWTGIGWNGVGENWLPDLTRRYIDKLPRDPRNTSIQHAQYIYFSNGKDYKLLVMNAEECWLVTLLQPWLNDAVRNRSGLCMTYGFQTSGAKAW